jgi:hypothetical protein
LLVWWSRARVPGDQASAKTKKAKVRKDCFECVGTAIEIANAEMIDRTVDDNRTVAGKGAVTKTARLLKLRTE